ncbi:MAG: subtilisin-like serine [Planctomycetota bacterium]|nr:MAG: subtilisin-like serine [Planctomycetota bacterium]
MAVREEVGWASVERPLPAGLAVESRSRLLRGLALALLTALAASAEEPAASRKIEPESQLNRHKKLVFVCFKDQLFADRSGYPAFCAKHETTPRAEVRELAIGELKKKAADSMAAWRKNPVAGIEIKRSCWLVNGFIGEAAEAAALETAAKREDVLFVYRVGGGDGMGASPGAVPAEVYGETNKDGTLKVVAEPPFTAKGLKVSKSLDLIQAPTAWQAGVSGQGVVVAVFDSGVYPACGDLREAMWVNAGEIPGNGKDDDGNGLVDDVFGANLSAANGDIVARELPAMSAKLGAKTSHGHMCAGMIAGRGKNGILTGVAPRARIMPVIGSTDLWIDAFEYVIDHGGDVVSMSFMGPTTEEYRSLWRRMAEHASASCLLLCGGAGNNGQTKNPVQIFNPKDIPCVMAGAGVDLDKARAPFSSKGPVSWEKVPFYEDYPLKGGGFLRKPDVCACATGFEGILFEGAAKPGAQGNSFSGPQIAGCAALLLEANPEIKPWQIQRAINETAGDLGPKGWDAEYGWGLMNCRAAVEAARKLKGSGK